MDKVLSQFKGLRFSLLLHKEQKECIYNLFCQRDVLAVLPTDFGKSLIFQVIVRVKEVITKKNAKVIVVCPLRSIEQDQVIEANALGLTAASLKESALDDVADGSSYLDQLKMF